MHNIIVNMGNSPLYSQNVGSGTIGVFLENGWMPENH